MKYTVDNYEMFALDYIEGTMSAEDKEDFAAFLILHPKIHDEFDQFDLLIVPIDESIKFPNKDQLLRKKEPVILPFQVNRVLLRIAAAAIVLITVGYYIFSSVRETPYSPIVEAEKTNQKSHIETPNEIISERKDALAYDQETKTSETEKTFTIDPHQESNTIDVGKKPLVKTHQDIVANLQETISEIIPSESQIEIEIEIEQKENKTREVRAFATLSLLPSRHFETKYEEEYLIDFVPFIFPEVNPMREKTTLGKFFAKTKLIPRALEGLSREAFRERLLPEAYQGPTFSDSDDE